MKPARILFSPARSRTSISRFVGLSLAVWLLGGSSCLTSPFLSTSGPSQAEGVRVSLARQRCNFNPAGTRPDQSRGDLDVWMRLKVTNETHQVITVDPRRVQLVSGNAAGDRPLVAGGARSVLPSHTENIEVRFRQQGNSGCAERMSLNLDQCVEEEGRSVPLRPVAFIAGGNSNDGTGGDETGVFNKAPDDAASGGVF